jgi:hypothetical protein
MEKKPLELEKVEINVRDFSNFIAENLKGGK